MWLLSGIVGCEQSRVFCRTLPDPLGVFCSDGLVWSIEALAELVSVVAAVVAVVVMSVVMAVVTAVETVVWIWALGHRLVSVLLFGVPFLRGLSAYASVYKLHYIESTRTLGLYGKI